LRFLRDRCSDAPLNNERLMLRFYSRFLSILKVQVPIIAAINGPAVGAGLCLACACDIRITAPQATLGLTFAKLGLHPGMGITHTLPQILGPEQAAKLLYTGGTFKGVDALEMGLVSQVSEDPLEAAIELANSMPDGRAVNSIVNTLRTQRVQGLDQMLQREAASQALCYSGPQFKTIIDSMIKKVKSEDSSTVTAPE
jgi:enoyl-CoA hydratase